MNPTEAIVRERDHVVQLYERDDEVVRAVADYLADALRAGETAVVIATPDHRVAFAEAVRDSGVSVDDAAADGRYVALDAAEVLSSLCDGSVVDPDAFEATVGAVVREMVASGRRVRAYGEMVSLLWEAGKVAAVIELEDAWNRLAEELDFSLYCAYDLSARVVTEHDAWRHVHDRHSAVVGRFERDLSSPRRARRFAVEALARAGLDSTSGDVALVVSELVTNAVIHARSDFTLALSPGPGAIRVAVRDHDPVLPTRRRPDSAAESGRGLEVIAKLCPRWGVEVFSDGKLVWAEFPL